MCQLFVRPSQLSHRSGLFFHQARHSFYCVSLSVLTWLRVIEASGLGEIIHYFDTATSIGETLDCVHLIQRQESAHVNLGYGDEISIHAL